MRSVNAMALEKCKRFMDLMDYGYDPLTHGGYSKKYKKKHGRDLRPGCLRDRLPSSKVSTAENNYKNALLHVETFENAAFENFASTKQIIASGKTVRAYAFFLARLMFDRIGELMAPGGYVEKAISNGEIQTVPPCVPKTGVEAEAHKKAKDEFKRKVAVFEGAVSHVHEIHVLAMKLREACSVAVVLSPEAKEPQIARIPPDHFVELVSGMGDASSYLSGYFRPSNSVWKNRFLGASQRLYRPQWTSILENGTIRSIVREIHSRNMTDSKFEKVLRLNALLA
jgi:hypothetical protein